MCPRGREACPKITRKSRRIQVTGDLFTIHLAWTDVASKLQILHLLLLLPSELCPAKMFNASYKGNREYYRLSSMILYSGKHYLTMVRGPAQRSDEWAVLDDDKPVIHHHTWLSVIKYCTSLRMRPTMLFFTAIDKQ